MNKKSEIKHKTREQSECKEWKEERTFRITSSNFKTIAMRKRNHDTFVDSLINPKHFTSQSMGRSTSQWHHSSMKATCSQQGGKCQCTNVV